MADMSQTSSQDSSKPSPNTNATGQSSPITSIDEFALDAPAEIMKLKTEPLDRALTPPIVCSMTPSTEQDVAAVDVDARKSFNLNVDASVFKPQDQSASNPRGSERRISSSSHSRQRYRLRNVAPQLPVLSQNFQEPTMVNSGGYTMHYSLDCHQPIFGYGHYAYYQNQIVPPPPAQVYYAATALDLPFDGHNHQIERLQRGLDDNDRRWRLKVITKEDEIHGLHDTNENNQKVIGDLRTQLKELSFKLDDRNARLERGKSDITNLQACLQKKNEDIKLRKANMVAKDAVHKMEIEVLTTQVREGGLELCKAKESLLKSMGDAKDLTDKISMLEDTISKLQNDILKADSNYAANQKHIDELMRLKPEMQAAQAEIASLGRKNKTLEGEKSRLSQECRGLKDGKKRLEADKSKLSQECVKLRDLEKEFKKHKCLEPSASKARKAQFSEPIETVAEVEEPSTTRVKPKFILKKTSAQDLGTIWCKNVREHVQTHCVTYVGTLALACIILIVLLILMVCWGCK